MKMHTIHRTLMLATFGATALGASTAIADGVHHLDLSMGHGCVANDCGTVWCWGGEEFVFGGDRGVKFKGSPSWPYQVGAGDRHSCVNVRDVNGPGGFANRGMIDCWGRNDYGQIDVPIEHDWRQLAVGSDHNCATNWSHRAICWGRDDFGQVSGAPPSEQFATISVHATQSCGVSRRAGGGDGERVRCWGKTAADVEVVSAGELQWPNERFVAVSAGGAHTCALSDFGEVYCWGENSASQLSPSVGGASTGIVTQLENGAEMHRIPGQLTFIDVAAGEISTCAVYDDFVLGERGVLCWGYPFSHGVSLWEDTTGGALSSHYLPLEGFHPEQVDVTFNEVCALDTDDGEMRCWSLSYTEKQWRCDPATDPRCCDDLAASCCEPAQEPACCDPTIDKYCAERRSWGLFPEVDPYACR
jgi:hypothetical protein